MTKEERQRDNALRLAVTLHQISESVSVVFQLAHILNYNQGQLKQDMEDIYQYIKYLERKEEEKA